MKKIFVSLLIILPGFVYAQQAAQSLFQNADTLYDSGNCAAAVPEYKKLIGPKLTNEEKERVLFRMSYCQFFLGKFANAEKGFAMFLKYKPDQQEARLKYAQSLYFNKKFKLAKSAAEQVKGSDFLTEAQLLRVLIATQEGDLEEANLLIKEIHVDKNHLAEIAYWEGVMEYNFDHDDIAKEEFETAVKLSPKGSWILPESQKWLESMEKSKNRIHGSISVGLLNDTNIAQSGGLVTSGEVGAAQSVAVNKYIIDNAVVVDFALRYTFMQKRKSSFIMTLDYTSPYYNNSSVYNFQNASLDFSYLNNPSRFQNYGISVKTLLTYYNYNGYQNYVIATPFGLWYLSDRFWFKISIPVNTYLDNKNIIVLSANLDTHYDLNDMFYVMLGGGYSTSTGPAAKISSTQQTVLSGTLFDRYTSFGEYVGGGINFSKTLQMSMTYSSYTLNYGLETDITGNVVGTTARSDVFTSSQMSLVHTIRPEKLYATLSFVYFDNHSTGLQGLTVNGYTPANSFYRSNTQLTLAYMF